MGKSSMRSSATLRSLWTASGGYTHNVAVEGTSLDSACICFGDIHKNGASEIEFHLRNMTVILLNNVTVMKLFSLIMYISKSWYHVELFS